MKTFIQSVKSDAKTLRSYLKSQGFSLAQTQALEAIARVRRYRNWATLLAKAKTVEALSPSIEKIRQWPSYVFFIDEDEQDDTLKETLYAMPRSVSLGDKGRYYAAGIFNDRDCRALSWEGLVLADIAIVSVHSIVPRIDHYGLPDYADEERAPKYFRDMGFACVNDPEVTFRDIGDDTAPRCWFEARVKPATARAIESRIS